METDVNGLCGACGRSLGLKCHVGCGRSAWFAAAAEPTPHYPSERLLFIHPATGLTVSEDLDTGGVWIRQETTGTLDEVYLVRGSWMVLAEWLSGGSRR